MIMIQKRSTVWPGRCRLLVHSTLPNALYQIVDIHDAMCDNYTATFWVNKYNLAVYLLPSNKRYLTPLNVATWLYPGLTQSRYFDNRAILEQLLVEVVLISCLVYGTYQIQ